MPTLKQIKKIQLSFIYLDKDGEPVGHDYFNFPLTATIMDILKKARVEKPPIASYVRVLFYPK